MRFPAILCLALLLGGSPALAQDAESLGLARDMLAAMKAADNFDAVLPTLLSAFKPALTANNPKAAKDWDDVTPLLLQEFSSSKNSLIDQIALVYAGAFSKDELRQYVAFYKTPAGQKLATQTPVIAQQTLALGQRFGQEAGARLVERMRDELRKRGNKI